MRLNAILHLQLPSPVTDDKHMSLGDYAVLEHDIITDPSALPFFDVFAQAHIRKYTIYQYKKVTKRR